MDTRLMTSALLASALLVGLSGCALASHAAVGHSYTPQTAGQYVPRDDDGDPQDIRVDMIAPLTSETDAVNTARRAAELIQNGVGNASVGLSVQYWTSATRAEQLAHARSALDTFSRVLLLPCSALADGEVDNWMSILKNARSRVIPVIIYCENASSERSGGIDSLYTAAYWNLNADGRTSAYEAIMSVVEDRPHEDVISTRIEEEE
ncbi:hypothetical protein B9G54_06910 [Alloscardovia macacae]|nr:hypothetical protein B9G54_06910 [Alloscardovia macacae]